MTHLNVHCRSTIAKIWKHPKYPLTDELIKIWCVHTHTMGFPGGSALKNPPANTGDMGLISASDISPGKGNGNPLQCSCLGNPMDRRAWQATVHGVAKSWGKLSN